MKLTKSYLKQLIKEELGLNMYKSINAASLDSRERRLIINVYKSMVAYVNRMEDPRYRKNREMDLKYLLKTAAELEQYVTANPSFAKEKDGLYFLNAAEKVKQKYGSQ
tara:strand:- start:1339 stop:1662 length:324 start_codon:yes stop_codon:yes gene_type:complete